MSKLGLIRVAAVTPKLKVANPDYNRKEILRCAKEADGNDAGLILFPELAITGYSCGDLFYQDFLYREQLSALSQITEASGSLRAAMVIGFYLRIENNYYNCAGLIKDGQLLGVVPKMFLPNSREFYESRWFASGIRIAGDITSVSLLDRQVPFGRLLFCDESNDLKLGIEICEDLWVPISPGSQLALGGAQILLNPSASNETMGKAAYRRSLISSESAKRMCGYVYASAGVHESTTDLVFSGAKIIAENGAILAENPLYQRDSQILYGEIDYSRIQFERTYGQNFEECTSEFGERSRILHVPLPELKVLKNGDKLIRRYSTSPFLSEGDSDSAEICGDIFQIQTAGLAKRLEHTGAKKVVLGISGGLDSTLALLVCAETMKLLNRPAADIIAVTMPGFGTTGKTHQNALTIMKLLGTESREIPIRNAILSHFKDIDHDPALCDVTYENAQARERTQILMDVANQTNGLVVGTGDLSEGALGWCTYNGDHMSMYAVNSSVPKTLIPHVIHWIMENRLSDFGQSDSNQENFEQQGLDHDDFSRKDLEQQGLEHDGLGQEPRQDTSRRNHRYSSDDRLLKEALQDIIDTPISPELLPPDSEGKIAQKTEDAVGPYLLHDFFLYHTLRCGVGPEKLMALAETAFQNQYDSAFLKKWLVVFYRRFFSQQFKRSCAPDGPKVGSVSLSPRGDWRMPSDADVKIWLDALE